MPSVSYIEVLDAIVHQTFFEHTILQHGFRQRLFQFGCLSTQPLHLIRCRLAHRITRQAFLSRLKEIFAPAIVLVRSNALTPTEGSNALFATYPFKNDPDLFFCRKLPTGLSIDATLNK